MKKRVFNNRTEPKVVYRVAPVKKIGTKYYKLYGTAGTLKRINLQKDHLVKSGYKTTISKHNDTYSIYYLMHDQSFAKREYERYQATK